LILEFFGLEACPEITHPHLKIRIAVDNVAANIGKILLKFSLRVISFLSVGTRKYLHPETIELAEPNGLIQFGAPGGQGIDARVLYDFDLAPRLR